MKLDGVQIVAELFDCLSERIDDEEFLTKILKEGILKSGLSLVETHCHHFEPYGITLIAIIKESHVAIHTYPESNHVSVDIFHCSNDTESLYILLHYVKQELEANSMKFLEIYRGQELRVNQKI
ncbi:adenosylmethionine decarboxylase [candidate division KSB1 bacterium]|nr:adenosylmethionine decarboxylase [candidate division KSB1 bacterium]